MKTMLIASAFALALTGSAFAAEDKIVPEDAIQMTDQEMDATRGGVGTFTGASDYTRIINLGSYSIVRLANGTWLRVKN